MKKIIISSTELRVALDKALTCITPNSSFLPISDFMLFHAGDEGTYIQLSDTKNHIRLKLDFETDAPGSLVVKHAELKKYLKLIPECPLVIKRLPKKDDAVSVVANGDSGRLPAEAAGAYPAFHKITAGQHIVIDRKQFKSTIEKAVKFTDRHSYSTVSGNVLISGNEKGLTIYSSDGYVAYTKSIPCKGAIGRFSFSPNIDQMLNIADDDQVKISVDNYKFQVEANGAVMLGVLFNQNYPPIERFFENYPEKFFKVNKAQFRSAVKRAVVFQSGSFSMLKLVFEEVLTIYSVDAALSLSFNTSLPYEADEPLRFSIGFTGEYLLKVIESREEEELTFFYTTPKYPLYINKDDEVSMVMTVDLDQYESQKQ